MSIDILRIAKWNWWVSDWKENHGKEKKRKLMMGSFWYDQFQPSACSFACSSYSAATDLHWDFLLNGHQEWRGQSPVPQAAHALQQSCLLVGVILNAWSGSVGDKREGLVCVCLLNHWSGIIHRPWRNDTKKNVIFCWYDTSAHSSNHHLQADEWTLISFFAFLLFFTSISSTMWYTLSSVCVTILIP